MCDINKFMMGVNITGYIFMYTLEVCNLLLITGPDELDFAVESF